MRPSRDSRPTFDEDERQSHQEEGDTLFEVDTVDVWDTEGLQSLHVSHLVYQRADTRSAT